MKLEILHQNFNASLVGSTSTDPFYKSMFESLGNYNYLIGAIMILLVILCGIWYPRAKRKAEDYKKRQLIEYNKNRPKQRDVLDYKKTTLYLPMREKAKLSAPVLLGLLCLFVGVTFFVGHSLTTL